ncbi:hypothetical protein BDN70DRAFT_991849 [Pholiota conissans]|uniref:Uncharacterized protein n=1 Tax=Pholiota conissans TaxID=109636 RepID=A0A9P5Z8N3_9AGAR|nr:hypothetical protein BDN70DRAFT_991849 [Pholiota conissans]
MTNAASSGATPRQFDIYQRILGLRVDIATLCGHNLAPYEENIILIGKVVRKLPFSPQLTVSRDNLFRSMLKAIAPDDYRQYENKPIDQLLPSRQGHPLTPPSSPVDFQGKVQTLVVYPDGQDIWTHCRIAQVKEKEIKIANEKAQTGQPIPKVAKPRTGIKHRPDLIIRRAPRSSGTTPKNQKTPPSLHHNPGRSVTPKRKREEDEGSATNADIQGSSHVPAESEERPSKKSRSSSPTLNGLTASIGSSTPVLQSSIAVIKQSGSVSPTVPSAQTTTAGDSCHSAIDVGSRSPSPHTPCPSPDRIRRSLGPPPESPKVTRYALRPRKG